MKPLLSDQVEDPLTSRTLILALRNRSEYFNFQYPKTAAMMDLAADKLQSIELFESDLDFLILSIPRFKRAHIFRTVGDKRTLCGRHYSAWAPRHPEGAITICLHCCREARKLMSRDNDE